MYSITRRLVDVYTILPLFTGYRAQHRAELPFSRAGGEPLFECPPECLYVVVVKFRMEHGAVG